MHWLLISVHACPSPEKGWGRWGVSNERHKKKYLVLPSELCSEEKVKPYDNTLMCSFPNFRFRICLTRVFLTAEENGLTGSKTTSKANLLGPKLQPAFPFCQSAQESASCAYREAEKYQVLSDSQCIHLTIKGHCLAIITLFIRRPWKTHLHHLKPSLQKARAAAARAVLLQLRLQAKQCEVPDYLQAEDSPSWSPIGLMSSLNNRRQQRCCTPT